MLLLGVFEIPAKLPAEQVAEIQQLAIRAFQAIDGAGLARVDLFGGDPTAPGDRVRHGRHVQPRPEVDDRDGLPRV